MLGLLCSWGYFVHNSKSLPNQGFVLVWRYFIQLNDKASYARQAPHGVISRCLQIAGVSKLKIFPSSLPVCPAVRACMLVIESFQVRRLVYPIASISAGGFLYFSRVMVNWCALPRHCLMQVKNNNKKTLAALRKQRRILVQLETARVSMEMSTKYTFSLMNSEKHFCCS